MKCPHCGHDNDKVIDSRIAEAGSAIRRRRECLSCGGRFSTYERVESAPIIVIKKDNSRQEYNKEKITSGIMRACVQRPVSYDDMQSVAYDIETQLIHSGIKEISSSEIGDMVLKRLRELDEVAYVRFASVYKRFDDINSFMEELDRLKQTRKQN